MVWVEVPPLKPIKKNCGMMDKQVLKHDLRRARNTDEATNLRTLDRSNGDWQPIGPDAGGSEHRDRL